MARDKLITIRIEREKRQAFGELAKSQNTDTASLLYDFISGCLDGRIDIALVMGKGNQIDNQLDSERIDKLETTTQRIDERVGQISKKLTDWVEAFSDRLNDCDQGLTNRMISLEHRLNTLASQLDSQQDSQQDRQEENPDIETVATVETADKVEAVYKVEAVDKDESDYEVEPDKGSIGPVPGDSIESVTGEAVTIGNKPWYTAKELLDCHYPGWPTTSDKLREKADKEHWPRRTRRGSKGNPYEYQAILPN